MPSTPVYSIPTPVMADPNDVPAHTLAIATATEAAVLKSADNKIAIGGVAYQHTGTFAVTPTSWTATPPLYTATISRAVPYPPPPGYKFVVTGVTSNSSHAVGAAGSQDGSTWQVRVIQFGAAALVELRVSWQLVKDL